MINCNVKFSFNFIFLEIYKIVLCLITLNKIDVSLFFVETKMRKVFEKSYSIVE